MGSEISSFVIEPLMGIGIIALAILSIIKENQSQQTSAKWYAIGSVSLTILLIIIGIVMAVFV
jgi:hypothetical protein